MTSLIIPQKSAHLNLSEIFNRLSMQNKYIAANSALIVSNQQKQTHPSDVSTFPFPQMPYATIGRYSETKPISSLANDLIAAQQIWQNEKITSTFYAFENQIRFLELLYTFRDKGRILHFLEMHKFLIPLLIETKLTITKFFPEARVFLEIETDPEVAMDTQLVAFISTHLPPKEAFHRLKQFDEAWWLNVIDQAKRKFFINVEF